MVLDRVVSSPNQKLGDRCPLVPMNCVGIHYNSVLLFSEGFALDLRVELVAPAEAAGLAGAAGDPLRNEGPVPGPVNHDQIG